MRSATLDVTTLEPLPCTACNGSGGAERYDGYFTGWNGVAEPIYRWLPCDACDGTGEAECQWCGETAAVIYVEGDAVCARCAEEDV